MDAIVDDLEIPNERLAWLQAAEDFGKPAFSRTESEMSRIMTLMLRLQFFAKMSFQERLVFAKHASFRRTAGGEVICAVKKASQATPQASALSGGGRSPSTTAISAHPFCIVVFGSVVLQLPSANGTKQAVLEKGEAFGSPLLMDALPLGAAYVSLEPAELLVLTRQQFLDFLGRVDDAELQRRVNFFKNMTVPIFSLTPQVDIDALARSVFPINVQSKELVVKEGDQSDAMYFITSGKLKVVREIDFTHSAGAPTVKLMELATLSQGEYFGELGLLRFSVDVNRKAKLQKLASDLNFDNDTSDASDVDEESKQIDVNAPSIARQATVFAHTPSHLLVLFKDGFARCVTNSALMRMREYAKGYPSQHDIRSHILKQQRWDAFKGSVMAQVHSAFTGTTAKPTIPAHAMPQAQQSPRHNSKPSNSM